MSNKNIFILYQQQGLIGPYLDTENKNNLTRESIFFEIKSLRTRDRSSATTRSSPSLEAWPWS